MGVTIIAPPSSSTFSGDAGDVPFTPAGTIAATDVQAAIEEAVTEGGASNFDDLLDYVPVTPSEGDLLIVGAGGSGVTNTTNDLTELDANETLVGVGVGQAPVAKTVSQMQTLYNIDKLAIAYTDSAPVDGTVVVVVRVPFGFTVNSLTTDVDSGTVTLDVKIGSTSITGLSAVAVTSTKTTTNATAANVAAVADEISFTFSSASTPVNFRATLNATRA